MGSCLSTCDGVSTVSEPKGKHLDSKALEVLEAEAKRDEELAALPSRMCANGSSGIASIYTQQGKKGMNQDCMVVWEEFGCREDTVFCGVFDGHGPYGHLVARRVRDSLPSTLIDQWHELVLSESERLEESQSGDKDAEISPSGSESCKVEPAMFPVWKESHLRAFKVMDKELKLHPILDCFCSGTTTVTIVKQGQDLVVANVGDSRAILGTLSDDNSLTAIQLTVDLKPNLPEEAERIRQCKGRVFALEDEPEVQRVWLPDDDSPGLAMARAFGDFCLKDYGVIAVPEVSYRRLTSRDQFIVLATDGVWDVLTNQDVVRIVSSSPTRVTAAKLVVESAVRAWKRKFPTSKIDDCAAVCLYVDSQMTSSVAEMQSEACGSELEAKQKSDQEQGSMKFITEVPCSQQNTNPTREINQTAGKPASRSLAECIATDDWSALEGLTRVNSLLSLPRVLLGDRKSRKSRRKFVCSKYSCKRRAK